MWGKVLMTIFVCGYLIVRVEKTIFTELSLSWTDIDFPVNWL